MIDTIFKTKSELFLAFKLEDLNETFVQGFPMKWSVNWENQNPPIYLDEVIQIFPEMFLGFSIFFLLMHGISISSSKIKNYPLVQSSISSLVVLVLIFNLILLSNILVTVNCLSLSNTFCLNYISLYSKQIILIFAIICIIITETYLKDQQINSFEYLILVLFSIFGLLLLCSSNDLLTAYLAIEIQSLAFYLLAAYKKNSSFATEAGLKYFILGSFSSGLLLFGASLIYGITGSTNFEDFKDLFFYINLSESSYKFIDFNILNIGLFFLIVSLFFKLALAPFHIWSPDIYEGSLTSSTVFFAVLPKLSIFVLLTNLLKASIYDLNVFTKPVIIVVGLFSIFIGSFVGIEIRKVKSLLAYSSVGHMGYILLACSTFTFEGKQAMFSYLFVYMLTSVCIWSVFLILRLKKFYIKKTNKDLSDFVSLNKSNTTLAVIFLVSLLSLAGFPPLIGFYIKVKVFFALIEETQYLVSIITILCSVISTFYYIRFIKVIFFEKTLVGNLYYPLKYFYSFITLLCTILFIYLFINPNLLFCFVYSFCF